MNLKVSFKNGGHYVLTSKRCYIDCILRNPHTICGYWLPTWVSTYIHHKVHDQITYPCSNINRKTVEVGHGLVISTHTGHVISHPCWTSNIIHVSSEGPRYQPNSTHIREEYFTSTGAIIPRRQKIYRISLSKNLNSSETDDVTSAKPKTKRVPIYGI